MHQPDCDLTTSATEASGSLTEWYLGLAVDSQHSLNIDANNAATSDVAVALKTNQCWQNILRSMGHLIAMQNQDLIKRELTLLHFIWKLPNHPCAQWTKHKLRKWGKLIAAHGNNQKQGTDRENSRMMTGLNACHLVLVALTLTPTGLAAHGREI